MGERTRGGKAVTAARAMPYLAAGAAGVGVGLAASAQAPLARAAPALGAALTGGIALAAAGGRFGLALVIVAAFFPVPLRAFGAVVGPPDAAVFLALACWAVRMMMGRRVSIARTKADWALSALVLAAVGSTLASALSAGPVPLGASVKKVAQLVLPFVGVYYFAASAASERASLRFACGALLVVAALEGLYAAVFQFAPAQLGMRGLWLPHLTERVGARAMGTVDACFGHYMAASLVLALAPATHERGRLRTVAALALAPLCAGVLSSGTRGSLLAAAAGFILLLVAAPRRLLVLAVMAMLPLVAGAAALLVPQVASPQELHALFTAHGSSHAVVRLLSWKVAWELAWAHPWLGLGPGTNALSIEALVGVPAQALRQVEGAMNAYLQAFLEMGVAGVVGLVGFIASVAGGAIARGDGVALGTAAALFALSITGITGPLLIGGIGHLFFITAGLAAAAARGERR